jgi:hypothetical protein
MIASRSSGKSKGKVSVLATSVSACISLCNRCTVWFVKLFIDKDRNTPVKDINWILNLNIPAFAQESGVEKHYLLWINLIKRPRPYKKWRCSSTQRHKTAWYKNFRVNGAQSPIG